MRVIGVVLLLLFAVLAGILFCGGVADAPDYEAVAGDVEILGLVEELGPSWEAECACSCMTCIQDASASSHASMDDTRQLSDANERLRGDHAEGVWCNDRTVISRSLRWPSTIVRAICLRTGRFAGACA